jgi:uncharacterized protein YndB with AHSA1/START domain
MITLTIILIALPVILIIAFFSSKGIKTSASITIGQPRQKVFDFLVQLKNQEYYNAWMMIDPKMQKTYTGTDGESGFILAWESKNKKDGKSSQRIINITSPEKIEVELIFEKPVASTAHYRFELTPLSDTQTQVNWIYEGNPAPYYFLRVSQLLLRLKKRVNKYMQTSLENLRNILEG